MQHIRHWSNLIVLILLVACSRPAETGPTNTPVIGQQLFFPQLKPTPEPRPFPQALKIGVLDADGGCLRVRDSRDGISYLVIWSPHVRLQGNSLVDPTSGQRAEFGLIAEFSGGTLRQNDPIFLELQAPLPEQCSGPYWLAGGIMRGN